jgi:hypothetical protein
MAKIPWSTILTHGPALVAAATRLMAGPGVDKNPTIEGRFDQLEKSSTESARLLQEVAQQVQALAIAQEQTARRARVGVTLGVAAAVIGIVACILAVAL